MAAWPVGAACRAGGVTVAHAPVAARPATVGDFDMLVGRVATFARLNSAQRASFLADATVREVPAGARVIAQGDDGDVGVLHPRRRGRGRASPTPTAAIAGCRRWVRATCSARSAR